MGRGDKKSRIGKIAMGSFGKSRPHKVKAKVAAKPAEPAATARDGTDAGSAAAKPSCCSA